MNQKDSYDFAAYKVFAMACFCMKIMGKSLKLTLRKALNFGGIAITGTR